MIRKLHKYISLTLILVWLLQAITGVSSVFFRELDAALVGGAGVPLNEVLQMDRIDELRLARQPGRLSSVYATGGDSSQVDVFLHTVDDGLHVLRVDGQGNVLREQPWAINFVRSGVQLSLRLIHESLFLGNRALLFIGLSGIFLITNIVLGLKLAWPRKGHWRNALTARSPARTDMRFRAWHRAVGLWVGVPLLVLVISGVGVAWNDTIANAIGDDPSHLIEHELEKIPYRPKQQASLSKALGAARELYPDARLSFIAMPTDGHAYFEIRLLQELEIGRVFGKTAVYVGAESADILANINAVSRPAHNRFLDAFYAIHTGEAGGLAGRLVVFTCGIGLLLMIGLGLSLWVSRSMQGRRVSSERSSRDRL